jgi:molybdopterin synthase catalytic subunit
MADDDTTNNLRYRQKESKIKDHVERIKKQSAELEKRRKLVSTAWKVGAVATGVVVVVVCITRYWYSS